QIGGAAARHEAGAAAHAETTAFGFLQQHRANQHGDDHEVDDDNDGLHLLPSVTSKERRIFGCTNGLRVFLKLRGVTRSDGALSPPTTDREIIAAASTTSCVGVPSSVILDLRQGLFLL